MIEQFAKLKDDHLVLIGFGLFFLSAATSIIVTVIAVQWRKARQIELELWFKNNLLDRGLSVADVERLSSENGKKNARYFANVEPQPSPPPVGGQNAFQQAQAKATAEAFPRRFYRPRFGRKIAGVCAGLAGYLGMPVFWTRVLTLALIPFGVFPILIAYILLAFFIPDELDLLAEQRRSGDRDLNAKAAVA